MKDIIWTLIIIWLIYKVTDVFKGFSKKNVNSQEDVNHEENLRTHTSAHNDQDIKSAVRKHLNTEGEYVDFEEMK
ncbi:MAG: hypothetical protein PSX36_06730 [bacterium]|nr:hypothetical protein [bacterium]